MSISWYSLFLSSARIYKYVYLNSCSAEEETDSYLSLCRGETKLRPSLLTFCANFFHQRLLLEVISRKTIAPTAIITIE